MGLRRADGPVSGQFAEWLAAHCYRLRLHRSDVQRPYDAVDPAGRTYQIKGVAGA